MKKQFLFIPAIAVGAAGSLYLAHNPHKNAPTQSIIPAIQTTDWLRSAQETCRQDIVQHEKEIWASLAQIGITKEKFSQEKRQFTQSRQATQGYSREKVSPANKKIITDVMRHFGLNPKQIPIVLCQDSSPAAASDTTLYINERIFDTMSERAKRFVIGHELQHMIESDNVSMYLLKRMVPKGQYRKDDPNDPINKYSRFQEKRADLRAAMQGIEWAEGYTAFMHSTIKRQGHNSGVSHPRNADRLQLAEYVEELIKHGQSSKAIQVA